MDADNSTIITVDPIKDLHNWYNYCGNNPTSYIDPMGLMATWELNGLSWLFNNEYIDDETVSTLTILNNGLGIMTVFHEIAQIYAANVMYKTGMGEAIIEYKVGNRHEADIVLNGMVWEVKPITQLNLSGPYEQLQKYITMSEENGTPLVHGISIGPIIDIPVFGKYKMGIISSQLGILNYFIYMGKCELENAKEYAENLNTVREDIIADKMKAVVTTAIVVAGTIVVATIVEDIITLGAGIVDDLASLIGAAGAAGGILAAVAALI